MFADFIKFGIRTGAIVVIIGIIVGVFAAIHLPAPDYTVFSQMIGKGYAMLNHWVPGFSGVWTVFTLTFGSWLAVQAARFLIYSSSIVLKIFK